MIVLLLGRMYAVDFINGTQEDRVPQAPVLLQDIWDGNCEEGSSVLGIDWGRDSPVSEGLYLSLVLLLGLVIQGLLLHVDHRATTCCCDQFIDIAENEFDRLVIEGNVSPSIEGEREGVTVKVTEDNSVLDASQDALQGTLQCLLHHLPEVIITGSFL